jgi:hypothetical protein
MISRKEERAMYEAETARLQARVVALSASEANAIEHCGRSSVRAEHAEDRAEATAHEATRMFGKFKRMTDERDELQARVVELRVALSIREAEVDALEARVEQAPRYLATELEKTND